MADFKSYYEQPAIVESYTQHTSLHTAEKVLIKQYEHAIKGKRLLDVAVGAGRTTPYLCSLAGKYIGIDYSKGMVERCRTAFEGVDFRQMDARQMTFEDESFDTVFFSYNGIDHVQHEDRLHVLKEIRRILKPGAPLIFCSHNLDDRRKSAYYFEGVHFDQNPGIMFRGNYKNLKNYFKNIINYQRNKKNEVYEEGYAILLDKPDFYTYLVYHINKEYQLKQLEELDFEHIQMINEAGEFITAGDICQDRWIYYVAQKKH